MKLAAGLIGGALILALGLGVWLGAGFLHQEPQPRTQLTVRLDTDAVPQLVVRTLFATVRDGTREPRLGYASIAPSGDGVELTILDGVDKNQALARLRELTRQGSTGGAEGSFTIADTGGAVLRLTPTPAAIAEGVARAVEQTIDVLRERIDGLALKPTFQLQGDGRFVIEVPRQPDAARLKALIVAPGKLAFRFVDTSMSAAQAKLGEMPPQTEILPDQKGTSYLLEKRIAMSGDNLIDAQPSLDQRSNEPIVTFRFNAVGAREFARMTGEKVGMPMAVVLDGVVLAAPIIREPILGGSGQISGNFTVDGANDLAMLLRSGTLPAPLSIIEEHTIEP
jgi:protein-export membrane protein SecD